MNKIIIYYYKIFGRLFFYFESKKRKRINENRETYTLIKNFRELENALSGIAYPNNDFNKIMSMILADLELFGHVVNRFYAHRQMLKNKTIGDKFFRFLNSEAKSYPAHPAESYINNAIKADMQSLFIFGMILVNRSLLLLKMYLPDQENNSKNPMYAKIGNFYFVLCNQEKLSPLSIKLSSVLLVKIKWIYSVLRFYRNEFIEHLDRGYQQGMNYGIYSDNFALSSYKWNYDDNDNERIEKFKLKLETLGITINSRTDGGRNLNNRHYIQKLFDNIVDVPSELLKEAMNLIEDIGVDSPQPTKIISEIELYISGLFNFMVQEISQSELAKYKK
jgi:hypothetical protein